MVALEHVNVFSFSQFQKVGDAWVGGALAYFEELERRRLETPGLAFIIVADEKVRGKVHQFLTEWRALYPTYPDALRCVLTGYVHFWSEARTDVYQTPKRSLPSPPGEPQQRWPPRAEPTKGRASGHDEEMAPRRRLLISRHRWRLSRLVRGADRARAGQTIG